MGRIIILGSASAVPTEGYENTHLLVETSNHLILVDCPGNPVVRLNQAGFDINQVTDIVLTHFHPDHVSGFASLLMSMWLLNRSQSINVYGLAVTLDKAQKMMELFDWQQWPNFFPVNFLLIDSVENTMVMSQSDLTIFSSPVEHLIPTVGLRFEFQKERKTVVYSCDTEPSQAVRRLTQGADVLIHEATGASKGHTSPEKAGEIAAQAGVGSLYLIHYPPQLIEPYLLQEKARLFFNGPVSVAKDFMEILIEDVL